MKVGIFGGTFNPVHHGHLVAAEQVREETGLDEILFVPVKEPVHKTENLLAPSLHRMEMLELVCESNPGFTVTGCEIERDGPSYTITTVHQMIEKRPGDEVSLVIGADSFNDFHKWYRWKDIIELVSLVVMQRPGEEIEPERYPEARVRVVQNPRLDISSTDIRNRIAEERSIRYLLPEVVREYIYRKGVYRT